jgi:hypothetical protein
MKSCAETDLRPARAGPGAGMAPLGVYRADVGFGRDNIYTRSTGADAADRAGDIPHPAAEGSAADQGPAGENDSYLVP